MSRFSAKNLPLAGLKKIQRQQLCDERGFLSRLFCDQELSTLGWSEAIAQINQTQTKARATVRGLHFQRPPHAEMKLVTCAQGEVWDVVVDVRAESPTFLRWHAEILSSNNCVSLLIPEGFAHGFQTLSDDVQMIYCHSHAYTAEFEAGLNAIDPTLNIKWPLVIAERSKRDILHPMLDDQFKGVRP